MFSWRPTFHSNSTVGCLMKYMVVQIAPTLHPRDAALKGAPLTGQGVFVPVACDGFYSTKEDAHEIATFMSESFPNLQTLVAEVLVADREDEVTLDFPALPFTGNEAPPAFIDKKKERAKMSAKLRYEVIKRDGYRCRACGFGVQDGAHLHVDHIVAIANGGETKKKNLQTLCTVCNLGKGAK